MAPLALRLADSGSPTFAGSEPQRGPFGPTGVLGPRPPRAGCWAPSYESDQPLKWSATQVL
eukprot:1358945-Alexandrium_andersonii.AAC.1